MEEKKINQKKWQTLQLRVLLLKLFNAMDLQ